MKRITLLTLCWTLLAGCIAFAVAAITPQIISNFAPESSSEAYKQFTAAYVAGGGGDENYFG